MTKHDGGGRIGVAGLGVEGAALCRRLQAAGYAVSGYDLDPVRALEYAEQGVGLCVTPAELAECPVVILTPQPDTDIETILFGERGLFDEEPDVLVVDLSLTEPVRCREFATRAARAGARWADAYWSGGPEQPWDGLVAVLGGLSPDVDIAAHVFTTLGCRCVHAGGVGDARTKGGQDARTPLPSSANSTTPSRTR